MIGKVSEKERVNRGRDERNLSEESHKKREKMERAKKPKQMGASHWHTKQDLLKTKFIINIPTKVKLQNYT